MNLKSAVMTFDPHPSAVLGRKTENIRYITPLEDKVDIIESMEIDYLFIVHFSKEFASVLPERFVDEYIAGLNVRHVVAGFDYSYGRYGQGSMADLPVYAQEGFHRQSLKNRHLKMKRLARRESGKLSVMATFPTSIIWLADAI